MMPLRRVPLRLRFLLISLGAALLILAGLRVAFWISFRESAPPMSSGDLLGAFFLGFRFDLRLCLLLLCPMLLLSWVPRLDPVRSKPARRFWAAHFSFLLSVILFFYFVDFAHYAYLDERVDASALRFLQDPEISFQMAWESYPVAAAVAALAVFGVALYLMLNWLLSRFITPETSPLSVPAMVLAVALTTVLYLFGIYGKISYYPLRWSDAFSTPHPFRSALALNPVLFFFDTLATVEERPYDERKVEAHYDRVASYLGVASPDPDRRLFPRTITPTPVGSRRPNVVLILLESFSANKTGAFGNPLNPSPNFDALAKESLFFRRFYTPRHGTARAVFATLTGIPDLLPTRTASRNPRIVSQYTVLGALPDYEKFYFLGGSATWANIRGLLSHNVEGLRIYEEGDYEGPRGDVWGISDLQLFEQADRVLSQVKERPFFALIHTSGNHRPYTIPEDNRGFEPASVPDDELAKYGFRSLGAFNSLRFLDHSIGHFMRLARTRDYFENTLFVLFGDNGTGGKSPHMPPVEEELGLGTYHVPFIIYGPGLIKQGKVFDTLASQMDILPTIAGLVGAPALDTTIGCNLLDPRLASERYALIQTERGAVPSLGLVGEDFFLTLNADGSDTRLYRYDSTRPILDVAGQYPDRVREMSELCLGLYHASKYLLYHNSPDLYRERLNEPGDAPMPGSLTEH